MQEISTNADNLSTMCRLCLSRDVMVLDIFAFSTRMDKQIANVIMDCAPVQITSHDEMPKLICQLCNTQLEKSYQFQKQVVQSDKTLRRFIHLLHASDNIIKTECPNQEPSGDALINCNIEAEITVKCESLEMHGVCCENLPQNFNSTTENINEMSLKSEVKEEPLNSKFQETLETSGDDSEIICEDSKINIDNCELSEGIYCTDLKTNELTNSKLADKLNENTSVKCEIKNAPLEKYVEDTAKNLSKCGGSKITCGNVTESVDKREEKKHTLNREKHKKANMTKCNQCNKCFVTKSDLKIHKLIHTSEKTYTCDVCNKCFNRSYSLKIHKRTHTGEKPYQCDVCNKCFAYSNSLNVHKLAHTGEKPFKCDMCDMCFSQSCNLIRHMVTHPRDV